MRKLYDLYGRIMPASKRQINDKASELNDRISGMERRISAQMNDRLGRIEKLLEMRSYGVTIEKRSPQIIVTMTSYPKRIDTVPLVLERLMNQTLLPDRIVLYLSEDNFPGKEDDLPQRLLDYRGFGLEIHWCEGDIKSYKKLIPALKEYPDDILITVDDDVYYPLDFVEKLMISYQKFPHAFAAFRIHYMTFDDIGKLLPYDQWRKCVSEPVLKPNFRMFATGSGGILYPPHIFMDDVFDEKLFMKLCPNGDDIWFKFMALMNGVPTVLAAPRGNRLDCIAETQKDTLWNTNEAENDVQIRALLDCYKDYRIDGKSIEAFLCEEE